MPVEDQPVTVLNEDESWQLLASQALGRLVTSLDGQPEIFPVNFVVQRPTVLFKTAEGTKLFAAIMNDRVAFEADDHAGDEGWSVIVKGRAHILVTQAEIAQAQQAKLLPWTATLKLRYVRVIASEITGRRFRFGSEPDPESTFA